MQTRLSPADPEHGKLSLPEIEERIRFRAYELYEQRGCADGHALDDWLEAKAQVLGVAAAKNKAERPPPGSEGQKCQNKSSCSQLKTSNQQVLD